MPIFLTQTDADALIAMPKQRVDDEVRLFPSPGGRVAVPLESVDRSEDFLIDITRSRIDLSKITYQNRARAVVVLLRLDLSGPPHRNPDEVEVPCPHLHIYREGYADRWAYPVPPHFVNLEDRMQTLLDFMTHCNVVDQPSLQAGLF